MLCRPVHGGGRLAGGVVHVKLVDVERRPAAEIGAQIRSHWPGLVGSGPLWLRGCQQVEAVYTTGDWLALLGLYDLLFALIAYAVFDFLLED